MKYQVKPSAVPYSEKETKSWGVKDFVAYFQDEYQKQFKIKSHKPSGMILAHVNSKSINFLYNQIKDEEPQTDRNELYKEFMDWLFVNKRTKTDNLIRVWFLSNKEIMTDFLDLRAKKRVDNELGSDEEFERQEKLRLERAYKFFNRKESTNV